ncbi:multidrug efflux SMR transporter [Glutamicibacter sp.]|uniref:DMT family transporter n=1 Tax=Glutamicibacter sp. TaxID=1931995 RepID=UPI0028BED06D|nr:multidrug efflux SMR transporter [Glutamicibacter sp.]
MSWLVLIVSGMFEAVWAIALGRSEGLSRVVPSVVFFSALLVSMGGLAFAMKEIPTGTAYAVWVGIGASLAVIYSMATGEEPFTVMKMVFILGLIGCVIGLKAVSH